MTTSERSTTLYLLALAPLACLTILWAVVGIPPQKVDAGVLTLVVLTLFCSTYLRLAVPRTNLHLTLSDGLVILSMLLYGGEIAVLLAVLEAACESVYMRRQGIAIKAKTAILDMMVAAVSVFTASKAVSYVFGSIDLLLQRGDFSSIMWAVIAFATIFFTVHSVLHAVYASLMNGRPFWTEWTENCFHLVVMFITGAAIAGIIERALVELNIFVIAGSVLFVGIIYLTFRRFAEDMKRNVEKAREAERKRAEDAEAKIVELQRYVDDMEKSGEELKKSHENFRHAAYHDSLTGLPNRNYFIDSLKDLLQQSREDNETNFAVLFLDLKSFKTINDSLGHSMGDRLIKNVSRRLEGMVREDDVVARFSGDKFGIILMDLLSRDEATGFADRLAKRLAEPYTLDGRQVFTSAKVGIAYGNSRYPEAEDILRDADIAMYYAKDNEENYVIFDQKMHIRAVTRLQLETDLRFAIERDEFELYYQPIIGLNSASLVGFEALVRWNHPQRGLVPPNEFIPISENTGLIIPMTVQILQKACSQIVKWQEQWESATPLSIAVNLSGKHFAHPALVDQITTVIDETGIDPSSLKLELTESAVMENAETAILMLKQIKETGVQISIDDFGTGYSSLSYLHRFPIDLLKVDRSFVSAMEENSENGEIVRTVIALAKALNLKVVAEGIESIHQFHQLMVLGCEYGQGYLFSKPLPVGEIERLLQDTSRWQNILPSKTLPITSHHDHAQLRLA